MKIGIISDIHSNYFCLRKVLNHMPEVDKIVCCGDLIGYGFRPNKTINLVQDKVDIVVKGNHDKYLESPRFLSTMPRFSSLRISKENKKWLSNLNQKEEIEEYLVIHEEQQDSIKKYKGLIFGHTHEQIVKKQNNLQLINPGNVGVPRLSSLSFRPQYAILDTKENKVNLKSISLLKNKR